MTWILPKAVCLGSSPRVGELPSVYQVACRGRGIIPSCGGTAKALVRAGGAIREHPLVWGNCEDRYLRIGNRVGASPRVGELPY